MEANTVWSKPLFVAERLKARGLTLADAPALQSLVIDCREFILLTEGYSGWYFFLPRRAPETQKSRQC
jgi:sulfur transfer complex TusBCD TusB component (DsrH family)